MVMMWVPVGAPSLNICFKAACYMLSASQCSRTGFLDSSAVLESPKVLLTQCTRAVLLFLIAVQNTYTEAA